MGLTRINELGVAENKEPPGDPKWRRYANLTVLWLSARSASVVLQEFLYRLAHERCCHGLDIQTGIAIPTSGTVLPHPPLAQMK